MASLLFIPLLALHIAAGGIALIAGLTAMIARKAPGGMHGRAGTWFFVAMLVMAASAAALTLWEPDPLSLIAALLAAYLVTTARMAARGRSQPAALALAALAALACAATDITFGVLALQSAEGAVAGFGPEPFFAFAALAALAAMLDLRILTGGDTPPRQRIARHLWRMCVAYFLAATSFFLGQQDDVFPFMEGSPMLAAPSLATLAFMVFWLARVGFSPRWPALASLSR